MAQKRLELVTVRILLTLVLLCLIPAAAAAEDGHAWLRTPRARPCGCRPRPSAGSTVSSRSGTHPDPEGARRDRAGVRGLLGRDLKPAVSLPADGAIVLAQVARLADVQLQLTGMRPLVTATPSRRFGGARPCTP